MGRSEFTGGKTYCQPTGIGTSICREVVMRFGFGEWHIVSEPVDARTESFPSVSENDLTYADGQLNQKHFFTEASTGAFKSL